MRHFVVILILLICSPLNSHAQTDLSFEKWLDNFEKTAANRGISEATLTRAFAQIRPNKRVVELDRKQPEKKWTFSEYQDLVINAARIQKGRRLYRQNQEVLAQIERKYGVPGQIIVALWGIESNFGQNTGGFDVIEALATLAWEGRREAFFSKELLNALQIIDQGHIQRDDMRGSWAGAMGQSQFMPSSFLNYAQDANGDGRKDIWNTRADVFASAANYLAQNGWEEKYRWGRRVRLPEGFANDLIDLDVEYPLSQWQKKGVRMPGGKNLPNAPELKASIIAPDGVDGPVFMVYHNFKVLMRWNRSIFFAASIGILSDSIAR